MIGFPFKNYFLYENFEERKVLKIFIRGVLKIYI